MNQPSLVAPPQGLNPRPRLSTPNLLLRLVLDWAIKRLIVQYEILHADPDDALSASRIADAARAAGVRVS